MHACKYLLLFQITEVNRGVSFDPRVGFTLTLHKITDSGDYVCKAVQGTTEQEVIFHIIVNRKCMIHVEQKFSCLR
jgi:hypothetical protein